MSSDFNYVPPNYAGYNQQYADPQAQQQAQQQAYGQSYDAIETYGSIIKELTDTEKIMDTFELRLRGKMRDDNNRIVDDPSGTQYVKSDQAAREFVNLVRSIVNRHTDFSYYETKEAYELLDGSCNQIAEWLMVQGDAVPLGYRQKIGFEALAYMKASLHKAINGRMLTWTKGAIMESNQLNKNNQQKTSVMDYILPWRKKNNG